MAKLKFRLTGGDGQGTIYIELEMRENKWKPVRAILFQDFGRGEGWDVLNDLRVLENSI
jgi:hypothetical protein